MPTSTECSLTKLKTIYSVINVYLFSVETALNKLKNETDVFPISRISTVLDISSLSNV